jgi:hypothetical protein
MLEPIIKGDSTVDQVKISGLNDPRNSKFELILNFTTPEGKNDVEMSSIILDSAFYDQKSVFKDFYHESKVI